MYLRGNYWHYDFYINKTRYRGTTGFTVGEKKKAVQMVETIKTGLRDDFAAELIIKTLQKKIKHKSPDNRRTAQMFRHRARDGRGQTELIRWSKLLLPRRN